MLDTNSKLQPDRDIPVGLTNAGKGRPPGTPNRSTRALKDAILLAAAEADSQMKAEAAKRDPNAFEGGVPEGTLEGYLTWLARAEPKSFSSLLGRIIPIQIKSTVPLGPTIADDPVKLGQALAFALAVGQLKQVQPGKTIEHEPAGGKPPGTP